MRVLKQVLGLIASYLETDNIHSLLQKHNLCQAYSRLVFQGKDRSGALGSQTCSLPTPDLSVTRGHSKYLAETVSKNVATEKEQHPCLLFLQHRFVGEANCAFNDPRVRMWQRGERTNGCKMGKQRTKKNTLTANLGGKGIASTRQVKQLPPAKVQPPGF